MKAHRSPVSNETPEMVASIDPLKAGFALTDPNDTRHQYITALKSRFGTLLHSASTSMRSQSEENVLDGVHMLVSPFYLYKLDTEFLCLDSLDTNLHARLWRQQGQVCSSPRNVGPPDDLSQLLRPAGSLSHGVKYHSPICKPESVAEGCAHSPCTVIIKDLLNKFTF